MFDPEIPSRYIEAHYEPGDRLAVLLINRKTGVVKHEFGSAEFLASPRYQAHLRAANAHGADVYLSVNTLKPDARRRTKTDIAAIRHLYLDIDEGGPAALNKLLLDRDMPKPHSVLESSQGKYQVLWQVENFSAEHAETVVRGLARRFGADAAVWDTARVLRVPGFRNHKYETPHYVAEIPNSPPPYRLRPLDFPAFPDSTSQTAEPGNVASHRQAGYAHHSQSERDWAFANRALERGEDPAVIKQKIATFRHDKHNPVSYAERTVNKAQTARNRSPARPHRRPGNSQGPNF
jgi:DNA primase RepB-like protein